MQKVKMMKTKFVGFFFFLSSLLIAQTTHISDTNFEQALIDLGYDDVLDNSVITANINTLTELDITSKSISDLTGIEAFIALKNLSCSDNNLTSLNTNSINTLEYLDCSNNNLTSLNINSGLKYLYSSSNNLSNLDISQAIALQTISCTNNNLSVLNTSSNTSLEKLLVSSNNLTSLNIEANTALKLLSCSSNNLTNLNTTSNTELIYIYCSNNNLETIDVVTSTDLKHLYAVNNNLTNLDVSSNTVLDRISLTDNNLASINIKNGSNTGIYNYAFEMNNNPELTCIQVDNATYSTNNWTNIDGTVNFSEDCEYDLSVEKIEKEYYHIYPNPVVNTLKIESSEAIDTVVILNLYGSEVVRTTSTKNIELHYLPPGVYVVRLLSQGKIINKKIVKQ